MKVTIDVDLGTVPTDGLFDRLTPDDWRRVAEQIAARVYSDPVGQKEAIEQGVDAAMDADCQEAAAAAARSNCSWSDTKYPQWLRPWASRSFNGDMRTSPEWRNERARRLSSTPAAAAVAAVDRLVQAHVTERVAAMFAQDERLAFLVDQAVAAVDLDGLLLKALTKSFKMKVADALRAEADPEERGY